MMKKMRAVLQWMGFFFFIAILVIYMGGHPISAFTGSDVEKVKQTGSCAGCNLRHANLAGLNLANADLSGADLSGADLRGADLSGANLISAKLGDAVLTNANLADANLKDAILGGAYMSGTDFSRATWVDGRSCRADSRGKCE